MSGNIFRFKKFAVDQSLSAMKVGTDGVLLGAWLRMEPADRRFLDIGTGTGLIALMLAQRFEELHGGVPDDVIIDAVEIDHDSAVQAADNVAASNWSAMIRVHHSSIQNFADSIGEKYDNIVSNPPWFVDSLLSPHAARTTARHTCALSYDELVGCAAGLLADDGRFSAVLPFDSETMFLTACRNHNLVVARRTEVFTTPDSSPKRLLLELKLHSSEACCCDSITIGTGQHEVFTEQYKNLTAPFYLKF